MIKEYLQLAIKNITNRALRSWLTILGIVIGVFLVVSLLSLSEGVSRAITSELQSVGGNLIVVMPGGGTGGMEGNAGAMMSGAELEDNEIEAIERANGVEAVVETPTDIEVFRYYDQSESAMLFGVDFGQGLNLMLSDGGWELDKGELPRPGRKELLVGALVPEDIFPRLEPGDEMTVGGRTFSVAGVLESTGSENDDSSIIMDLNTYRSVTGTREGTPVAIVKAKEDFEVERVVSNIEYALEEEMVRPRGEESPDFTVMSSEAMLEMVDNVLGVLQMGILAFASVAIVVGAIGVMNTMFTSVRERTKEIGVFKAIGAKRKHISRLFLVESGIIGLIGGLLGTGLGMLAAKLGEWIITQNSEAMIVEAHFSVTMILSVLLFSFLLGCVSGFWPARRAAKLDPADALRYE